jgi:phosphoribosylamine-glycine ligase
MLNIESRSSILDPRSSILDPHIVFGIMKVFVIGSGGREHVLVWSLARSPHVKQIYSSTANAGILKQTKPAGVSAGDIYSIAEFAAREKIDLVVIGPEQPLVEPRLKEVLLLAH